MKQQDKKEKQADRKTLDRLCSASGLLLSVVCCIALIHVQLTIQEHHRLISNSVTFCDQMKTEILRQVQQNYGSRQVMATGRHWQATKGEQETVVSRQKRSAPDDSQQKSTLTASEVQMLIKQELGLLQNQVCAKDHTLCRTGPRGNTGRRGRPGTRGRPGPQGDPG
ncbi:hypothetical protein OS493_015689 [Desmophyllum pertusum]|uniref:Uncharacterized protein n=1 Tax=Desmophyllum pertusum TaxID=174260 RepID=A0A9X0CKU4_9CNID|nr:hypothetical protein OS493_015689 [Desmophyllum pertusum]